MTEKNRPAEVSVQNGRQAIAAHLSSAGLSSVALTSVALSSAVLPSVRLHRDERGTISMLTLTTIIGLMMLMGMVINVGRHIDDKVKMQNAADAAAYSGGTVLALGMNSISFTNHLLCDIFGLTAFMREARDRNAEALVPEVLGAWSKIGPIFERAEFAKFQRLGPAISQKAPLEQELVRSYSEMSAAISELVLPVLEYVLRERLIPEFQRTVVQTIPQLASQTANEIARRHGKKQPQRPQMALLWRTRVQPVGYPDELNPLERTLPAIDPTPPTDNSSAGGSPGSGQSFPIRDPHPDSREGQDFNAVPNASQYLMIAIRQREQFAKHYLERWTADRLQFFANEGKMSQFINLWRVFTCGQLTQLLTIEYPMSNLPHVIRATEEGLEPETLKQHQFDDPVRTRAYLDRNFMFVGIAYRRKFTESFNGLFKNPLSSDPLAFAQIHLFIPRPRLWSSESAAVGAGSGMAPAGSGGGGGFGVDVNVPTPGAPGVGTSPGTGSATGYWFSDRWPTYWDLFNQNWTVQLVPATTDTLAELIQSNPPAGAFTPTAPTTVQVPRLGGTTPRQIRQINAH